MTKGSYWSRWDSISLCQDHHDEFDKWWDPERFDWKNSWALSEFCSANLQTWWDPDKFNWGGSYMLAQHCSKDFDTWWDGKKFQWCQSKYLAQHCSKHFDKWWDPERYDWNNVYPLIKNCYSNFDKWWEPEKINWGKESKNLAQYCSKYFDIWWEPEKYNWRWSENLAQYCFDHFDKWWDANKYDWRFSELLAIHCSDHFDKWWNCEKYDWYCPRSLLNSVQISSPKLKLNNYCCIKIVKQERLHRTYLTGERKMTKEEWWKKYSSFKLCEDYSDFFDEWWDPDKFDWLSSWLLSEYCSDHFEKWWDADKFNWDGSFGLSSPNFMLNKVDWSISVNSLLMHCLDKFSTLQIKQLLLHQNNEARKFAKEACRRRGDDKERVVE